MRVRNRFMLIGLIVVVVGVIVLLAALLALALSVACEKPRLPAIGATCTKSELD